jgi:hypothetical protein
MRQRREAGSDAGERGAEMTDRKAFDFSRWDMLDEDDVKAIEKVVRKACGKTVATMIDEYSGMGIELPSETSRSQGLPDDYCLAVSYYPNERNVAFRIKTLDELIDEVIDLHQLRNAKSEYLSKFAEKLRQLADKVDAENFPE